MIQEKNLMTYISNVPLNIDIALQVKSLGFSVIGNYESKGAKVNLREKNEQMKLLTLSHYTNSLT
jgi:hypothetical protein